MALIIQRHSFFDKKIERVMGIEPTYPAWKAGVLPLNYTREQQIYYTYAVTWCQDFFKKISLSLFPEFFAFAFLRMNMQIHLGTLL